MDKRLKKIQLFLMLSLFVGFVPMLLFLYWGGAPLNIYMNADKYKLGIFYLEELDCGNGHGSDDFNCYGYGKINERKVKVNLGKTKEIKSAKTSLNSLDLSKDSIPVLYRPNLKQTIVIRDNETILDKRKYLVKGVINLIYPIIIYPLLFFFYKKVKKRIENE